MTRAGWPTKGSGQIQSLKVPGATDRMRHTQTKENRQKADLTNKAASATFLSRQYKKLTKIANLKCKKKKKGKKLFEQVNMFRLGGTCVLV